VTRRRTLLLAAAPGLALLLFAAWTALRTTRPAVRPSAVPAASAAPAPRPDHRAAAASVTRSTLLPVPTASSPVATRTMAAAAPTGAAAVRPVAATPANTAAEPTAAELLARFVADDPTQVFESQVSVFHAAVQSEAVDPDWSPLAGRQLHDYLAAQLGATFEDPVVDCRRDLCEVQVAGADGDDGQFLQEVFAALPRQPWWSAYGLDQQTYAMTYSHGRPLLVFFVSRR
jgi:hypothetical protein